MNVRQSAKVDGRVFILTPDNEIYEKGKVVGKLKALPYANDEPAEGEVVKIKYEGDLLGYEAEWFVGKTKPYDAEIDFYFFVNDPDWILLRPNQFQAIMENIFSHIWTLEKRKLPIERDVEWALSHLKGEK